MPCAKPSATERCCSTEPHTGAEHDFFAPRDCLPKYIVRPMTVLLAMFQELLSLAQHFGTAPILLLAAVARMCVLSTARGSEPRARFWFAFSLFTLHVVMLFVAAVLSAFDANLAAEAKVGVGLFGTLAAVT